MRKKSEHMPNNDKIDQVFQSFGKPKYDKMFQEMTGREEKPKSTKSKVRESSKKVSSADILSLYEQESEKVRLDLLQGKIRYISDAKEELETRLIASGIDTKTAKEFCRIFEKRMIIEKANFSQSKQVIQAQPQPQPREPTLTEQAEIEAERVNRQRGYSQLIERNWACEICGRGNMTKDEAVACENSHQVSAITQENEPETPREQEVKIQAQPRPQPQALPQSDILFRLGKSLIGRLTKSPKSKTEAKTEEQQPQEESYSPVTYLSTVKWQAPPPVPTRVCEVCGETAEIGAWLAGHHGKGRCG
jgi:hypothetical protein